MILPIESIDVVEGTDDPELDEEGLKMSLKVLLVFGGKGRNVVRSRGSLSSTPVLSRSEYLASNLRLILPCWMVVLYRGRPAESS